MGKIGDFDPKYFVPVVGAREDGQSGITTPFERKHSRHASVEVKGTERLKSLWTCRCRFSRRTAEISSSEGWL